MSEVEEANAVKELHSARFLSIPGVSGIGVERDDELGAHIVVHLDAGRPDLADSLGDELDGVPVKYVADGPFTAFRDP